MKIVRFLPLLLLFALTITACSKDDDEPQVIPFPSEGITFTMDFDKMEVRELDNNLFYSYAFSCEYEYDFYYQTYNLISDYVFKSELLNNEYKDYIGLTYAVGTDKKDINSYAFKGIRLSVMLSKEQKDYFDELYKQLKTNPFRVKVYDK